MLDLPDAPVLDKTRLLGGCVRLPLQLDAGKLRSEIARLPEALWSSNAGRVGVHRAADAVFLRGYAPAEGDKPVEDRPVLTQLPSIRAVMDQMIGATPLRSVLARLPPGATIAPHRDDGAPYFAKTLRIHVPIESNDRTFMLCDGANYVMRPGEVWAIDNSAIHAVWNAHRTIARIHLICDYLPSPAVLALIAAGERGLGRAITVVDEHWARCMGQVDTASA